MRLACLHRARQCSQLPQEGNCTHAPPDTQNSTHVWEAAICVTGGSDQNVTLPGVCNPGYGVHGGPEYTTGLQHVLGKCMQQKTLIWACFTFLHKIHFPMISLKFLHSVPVGLCQGGKWGQLATSPQKAPGCSSKSGLARPSDSKGMTP